MLTKEQLEQLAALGGNVSALVQEVIDLRAALAKPLTPTVPPASPLRVANNVLIRSVTHYYTGRVEVLDAHEIVLSSAAWIPDTGRFYDALKSGQLNEVEPFPYGVASVGRGAVIDTSDWLHELPRTRK